MLNRLNLLLLGGALVAVLALWPAAPAAPMRVVARFNLPPAVSISCGPISYPATVSLAQDGTLRVMDRPVASADLVAEVRRARIGNPDQRVVLSPDRHAPYWAVVRLVKRLDAAGFDQIALVST